MNKKERVLQIKFTIRFPKFPTVDLIYSRLCDIFWVMPKKGRLKVFLWLTTCVIRVDIEKLVRLYSSVCPSTFVVTMILKWKVKIENITEFCEVKLPKTENKISHIYSLCIELQTCSGDFRCSTHRHPRQKFQSILQKHQKVNENLCH